MDQPKVLGQYACATCGNPLFEAAKRFEAGCGFPSFWMDLKGGVTKKRLTTYGRDRVQVLCQQCSQHLGHLFPSKHTPTAIRYCINEKAIKHTNSLLQHTLIMANGTVPIKQIEQTIRENRSSESNFETLQQELDKAIAAAQNSGNTKFENNLQEVKDKYVKAYKQAKEASGNAWPEFEKFVTQFERTITAFSSE